jgi:ankyrin repeat protein
MLEWILENFKGFNVDEMSSSVGTPLICAAAGVSPGHINCMKLLLKAKANVNIAREGVVTPLICAVAAGSLESASILLDAGADPLLFLPGCVTPLHIACEAGDINCVKLFLSLPNSKKLVNFLTQPLEGVSHHKAGLKPIHYAAGRKHREVIELLLPLTEYLAKETTVDSLIAEQEATGDWNLSTDSAVDISSLKIATIEEKEEAKKAKEEGNKFFLVKDWGNSCARYSRAIELDPHEAIYWNNRFIETVLSVYEYVDVTMFL